MEVIHLAKDRGNAKISWLESNYSFSFANYYDPKKVQFGALRVLNDDTIKPGRGFGLHPHDNMEIITIVLEGSLEHKDNKGNREIVHKGEIQVMSAGTGIEHSEINPSLAEDVKLLQIWILPKLIDIAPSYAQKNFEYDKDLTPVASGFGEGLQINQEALVGMANIKDKWKYERRRKGNGVYIFVIEGHITARGHELARRDAIGIADDKEIILEGESTALIIEVPMDYEETG